MVERDGYRVIYMSTGKSRAVEQYTGLKGRFRKEKEAENKIFNKRYVTMRV